MSKRNSKSSNGDQMETVDTCEKVNSQSPSLASLKEQDVAELAYQRWVERGCPQGSPEEDWFEAESALQLTYSLVIAVRSGGISELPPGRIATELTISHGVCQEEIK